MAAWTVVCIAMMLVAAPARAQTYDPNYPVCLQSYSLGGSSINCGFTSMAQCQATASGRSAQCLDNPYFSRATPPSRVDRRRRAYR